MVLFGNTAQRMNSGMRSLSVGETDGFTKLEAHLFIRFSSAAQKL